MKKNQKAQAAMEYLMTYGWAILIVLIALGALFYLGVFTPQTQNSGKIEAPFTYLDMRFAEGGATGTIKIGASGAIESFPAGSISHVSGSPCTTVAWVGTPSVGENEITVSGCGTLTEGQKVSGVIEITYVQFGGFEHTRKLSYSASAE